MEDAIHEANTGAFVWILIWEFDVDFPYTAGEGCFGDGEYGIAIVQCACMHTLFRTLESDIEFLPFRASKLSGSLDP